MTIDWSKPVKTRDGRDVIIYTLEAKGDYPVHGAIAKFHEGKEFHDANTWTSCGKFIGDRHPRDSDLVNVKQKKSGWVNITPSDYCVYFMSVIYPTKELAQEQASGRTVDTIEIHWEE